MLADIMLLLIVALPFVAALLCLALNRIVPTRALGLGVAATLVIAAAVLLFVRLRGGLPLALPAYAWAALDDRPVYLALRFDGASWPLALLVLGGGALAMWELAQAVPAGLHGFGGLFAALVLMVLASLAGLANQDPLLLPFAWALVTLFTAMALRASGATAGSDRLPVGVLAGLLGALVLLGAALALPPEEQVATVPPAVLAGWALVGLLAIGAPPFHASLDELSPAPSALMGILLALGLPLLGGHALMRFVAAQDGLPPHWRTLLMVVGILTLLACAAGATATSSARRLIGWQFSAQMGLWLMAVGRGSAALNSAAPALLTNAVLTTLVCYLALAVLERRAGTDDLSVIGAPGPLVLPGLAFLIGAASAIGIPGTWGWWARRWLFDDVLRTVPWAVPVILAASALAALAYIAPLAAFWRDAHSAPTGRARQERSAPAPASLIGPALAALPLLIWGAMPQLAWMGWLSAAQVTLAPDAPAAPPALPGGWTRIAYAAAAILLLLPIGWRRSTPRCAQADPDVHAPGVLTPQALGHSLRGLAWLGSPSGLFERLWEGLLRLSRTIQRLLTPFERRYYLAGLMIALIVVILLLI